jgi:hypothetical protein
MNDVVDRILTTYQLMRPLDPDRVSDSRRKGTRYIESLAAAGQSDAQRLAVYGLAYLKELRGARSSVYRLLESSIARRSRPAGFSVVPFQLPLSKRPSVALRQQFHARFQRGHHVLSADQARYDWDADRPEGTSQPANRKTAGKQPYVKRLVTDDRMVRGPPIAQTISQRKCCGNDRIFIIRHAGDQKLIYPALQILILRRAFRIRPVNAYLL